MMSEIEQKRAELVTELHEIDVDMAASNAEHAIGKMNKAEKADDAEWRAWAVARKMEIQRELRILNLERKRDNVEISKQLSLVTHLAEISTKLDKMISLMDLPL